MKTNTKVNILENQKLISIGRRLPSAGVVGLPKQGFWTNIKVDIAT